ncbi:SIMPL domain-containing protein [Komagataeibacter swingsii]|uniref:SIMPL domain-containing protein n=1 Tax=Komagataeibacter swingsii TaxID=215220 RepID=A0A850P228_9PROT|nr:SIMPL domain-containing protein [Komagataeibacter swingsii]NVN36456.1 SIMPL domain-containing protein [Komagataeibacter swingsii]
MTFPLFTTPVRHSLRVALPGLLAAATLHPAGSMAQTQPANALPPNTTELELSASGTVQAQPDELTATFLAEARADTAASAQAQVNALVGKVTAASAHVTGLTLNAESYFVHHDDGDSRQNRRPQWVARQSIRLTASDGKVLLPLVGQLQADNLALTRLDWSLSREKRMELTRKAETLALQDMQQRAQAAAATLKLNVAFIRTVTLEDDNMPRPMPMMMMMPRAASIETAPPEAPTGMQDVTATVRARLVLKPAG